MGKYDDRNKKAKKKRLTNEEKVELFIKAQYESMASLIEQGKIVISPHRKHLQFDRSSDPKNLEEIEESLKSLRFNIKEQRNEEKEIEKAKRLQAHEFLVKMKKDKEQHKRKIEEKQHKSVLHSRIFSESTIGKMRQRLEERIAIKRKELEERVKSIADRKHQRDSQRTEQQIQYWQKVKSLHKNSESNRQLPSLNPEAQHKRRKSQVQLTSTRKNNVGQEPKDTQPYDKKIDFYLIKAKLKQQNLNMKVAEKKNQERLNRIITNNQQLVKEISESQSNQFLPIHVNKSKLYGDHYLQESLLKIKKGGVPALNESEVASLHQSIEIRAQEKFISKNEQTEKMKQSWSRVLSRLKHNEVTQEQGLQLLNSIERRLDKLNPQGISERLKKKYDLFAPSPAFAELKESGILREEDVK